MRWIGKHMISKHPGGALTPFRPIEGRYALIPTLKGAKKALGDWVQHPNIWTHPAKGSEFNIQSRLHGLRRDGGKLA